MCYVGSACAACDGIGRWIASAPGPGRPDGDACFKMYASIRDARRVVRPKAGRVGAMHSGRGGGRPAQRRHNHPFGVEGTTVVGSCHLGADIRAYGAKRPLATHGVPVGASVSSSGATFVVAGRRQVPRRLPLWAGPSYHRPAGPETPSAGYDAVRPRGVAVGPHGLESNFAFPARFVAAPEQIREQLRGIVTQ